ncbi:MAG: DUF305 domain-containing protein, partial [Anderseniella sp.]
MRVYFKSVILLLFSLLLLSACTGAMPGMSGMSSDANGTMQTMDQATAMPMDHSNMVMDADQPFDAQFIDSMIEHHQGAIDMAQE